MTNPNISSFDVFAPVFYNGNSLFSFFLTIGPSLFQTLLLFLGSVYLMITHVAFREVTSFLFLTSVLGS